jgi:hypothetical protein
MLVNKIETRKSCRRFVRILIGAVVATLLGVNGQSWTFAQSVEKSETSQQVKQQEDELQLAREAVKKAAAETPQALETGRLWGDYTVVSTMEMGYRFVDVNGSKNFFLSDVNVRDGWRLFDFSVDARSITGSGPLFDFFRADVMNAGGDRGQYFSLRADKTRAYKFDATVRRFNYFRYLPDFVLNEHNRDLRQQISDFNLKLFPQRKVRLNLGYGRSVAKGPYFSTYDAERDEFPIDGETRWVANDYRIGTDINIGRWQIFAEQLFRSYKDDSIAFQPNNNNPGSPTAPAVLTSFVRDEPIRSDARVSRMNLRGDITSRAHLVLRALYSDEDMEVTQVEQTTGKDASGNQILSRRIVSNANAHRPSTTADAIFTYDITDKISVSNSFRFYSYKIGGDVNALTRSTVQSAATGVITNPIVPLVDFRYTGVKSYWNTVTASYSPSRKFSATGGYRFTHRDVTLGVLKQKNEEEMQDTHTLLAGARFRPTKRIGFFADYERGERDNAFVRINPLDYQLIRARANIEARDTLSFHVTFTAAERTNPTRFVENDFTSRSISFSASWQPNARVYLNGGYDYNYLFSTADIIFFVNNAKKQGRSLYYARQDFVFIDTRLALTKRLDLLMVYRYTGDRGQPDPSIFGPAPGPNDFISTLPLTRHNPEVRLAYRFSNHLTGNVTYRHYSYNEREGLNQDYRANILTTSVRFTF